MPLKGSQPVLTLLSKEPKSQAGSMRRRGVHMAKTSLRIRLKKLFRPNDTKSDWRGTFYMLVALAAVLIIALSLQLAGALTHIITTPIAERIYRRLYERAI